MERIERIKHGLGRVLDFVGAALLLLVVGLCAWAQAQDGTAAMAAGTTVTVGWDFLVLTGLTLGIYKLARKLMPDEIEAKWLPVVMHSWSLSGTFVVAAIFGKLPGSWAAVVPLLGQAIAQSLLASGIFADLKKLSAFVPGSPTKGTTIGDL